jgi:hypothetical protein
VDLVVVDLVVVVATSVEVAVVEVGKNLITIKKKEIIRFPFFLFISNN